MLPLAIIPWSQVDIVNTTDSQDYSCQEVKGGKLFNQTVIFI